MKIRTIIIGGVAGGASAAARLRRLDDEREIIILERGPYISYANCGLPYHLSNAIVNSGSLLLMNPQMMWERFRIDVRVKNEVVSINKDKKSVTIKKIDTNELYEEHYDDLIIATGSSPIRPNIPGIENNKIKSLWTVPDVDYIKNIINSNNVKKVAVIGGGFIGLEVAENLHHLGLEVTIIEGSNQVMGPIDMEMAQILHKHIIGNDVKLYLNSPVSFFEEKDNKVIVNLKNNDQIVADLVILSIGVRPNSALAKDAGLKLNERGGIIVDQNMKTSEENIYAVGDVVEVDDFIFKGKTMIPLAGPANKQGRIVADVLAGRNSTYKGTQGSSIAKVFDLSVASTGVNEKTLISKGLIKGKDYESAIIMQNSHAGYYPGAAPMFVKVLFSLVDEKIYGAQIVGVDGVDKRIDTLGVAIRFNAKVTDLKDLELAYAPPYNSAKDPVNMVGFVAENILTGITKFSNFDIVEKDNEALILDVREDIEVAMFKISNSKHIPLGQLRNRLKEINPNQKIVVFCAAGVRAHTASRILKQNGFANVEIYPGGINFYKLTH